MGAQNYIMGRLIKSTETLTAAEIENQGIEGKKMKLMNHMKHK